MKTLKIYFNNGSFKILNQVAEFSTGRFFFFVAQITDSTIQASAYRRTDVEEVYLKNVYGVYKPIKLPSFKTLKK